MFIGILCADDWQRHRFVTLQKGYSSMEQGYYEEAITFLRNIWVQALIYIGD